MLDFVYSFWVVPLVEPLVVVTCSVEDDMVAFSIVFSDELSGKREVSKVFRPVVISGASLVLAVIVEVDGILLVLSDIGVIVDVVTVLVVCCRLFAVVFILVVCICKVVASVVAGVVVATEL